jgi:hypothetical protein
LRQNVDRSHEKRVDRARLLNIALARRAEAASMTSSDCGRARVRLLQ